MPDDPITEQIATLAWLADRIACWRCRKALDTAGKAVSEMTISGQTIQPSPRLGRQFWSGYLIVLACTAAGHPEVLQDPATRPYPPPDHEQAHSPGVVVFTKADLIQCVCEGHAHQPIGQWGICGACDVCAVDPNRPAGDSPPDHGRLHP